MENYNASPLLTQVRGAYFSVDCGMSYILRLADGRFVIIDGNMGEYDEAEHLYYLLCEQNVRNDGITVAAWFITHPHGDHFGAFIEFFKKYADCVKLEKLIWSFPKKGVFSSEGSDIGEFLSTVYEVESRGTALVKPNTGDVFELCNARFDVIFTCEDVYPGPFKNINNSSLVMLCEFSGKRILWLGDIQSEAADFICEKTDPTRLKCDILQVGHHGYWGGSDALHRTADPEILLWPCPDFWYHPARCWTHNDFLVNSKNIRAIFVAGQEETVLDLSQPILPPTPYKNENITADLSKKSVCALNWSCMTGGSTGYAPASLEFTEKGCRLTAGNARSLCHLIHRGQTALTDSYELELSATLLCHAEQLGIMVDCQTPMDNTSLCPIALDIKPDCRFDCRVVTERDKNSVSVYINGALAAQRDLLTNAPCDIVLVMKNATLEIEKVAYKV